MILPTERIIVSLIRNLIIGRQLPTNQHGEAGRAAEDLLESVGVPINRGAGCDIQEFDWEVKTRNDSATSAQTIATIHPNDVIAYPYKQSPIYTKFRKRLRITTSTQNTIDNTIIAVDLIDFDQPHVQDLIESAYEHGRQQITANPGIGYTNYVGYYGYFEQTKATSKNYDFRLSDQDMDALVAAATSTFGALFS